MKLSEFKNSILDRLIILKASIIYTFQQETAYWTNNWANILSTLFYTISMIVFIDVIYANVDIVAGYNRNEMLLFMLIGQISYYSGWLIHFNLRELIEDVNKGNLDLILVKPIPTLFYVTFKKIKLFSIVRDSIPPITTIAFIINWSSLNLNIFNVFIGILISFLGLIIVHVIHFISTLPVFWLGESNAILDLSEAFEYNVGKIIPLEGYDLNLKIIFSTLLPVLITAGFASSVMLGKSNPFLLFFSTLLITTFFLLIREIFWKKALKAYTSASS